MWKNNAWVVFKYPCSVEDSIRLFRGTQLYGLPIEIKKYRKQNKNSNFQDQLKHFQQLVSIERSNQLNINNKNKWNNQNLDNEHNFPYSQSESLIHGYRRSDSTLLHNSKDTFYKYQQNASINNPISVYRSEYGTINKSQQSYGHYHARKSEYNSSDSMAVSYNDRNPSHSRNYDRKHRSHNSTSSFKEKSSNKQRSEKNHKNTHDFSLSSNNLLDNQRRKNNLANRDYKTQSFNKDKSFDRNEMHSRSTESNSHKDDYYHPYKQNDKSDERPKYKKTYDAQSNHRGGRKNDNKDTYTRRY